MADDKLHDLLGRRRPFLTAKRLLTNQVFRDLYGADTLDVGQRLKITSLTFLFTDLRGFHMIPGAGHWNQQENPAETNRLLLDWLKNL